MADTMEMLVNGVMTPVLVLDRALQEVDDTVDQVLIIPSSTAGSTKKFKLTVDDTGAITATEVTE